MIVDTHFHDQDLAVLIVGIGFVFSSILIFLKGKIKLSLLLLIVGGFILRFFIVRLDPFIYTWDEEFHALVAKNMMTNPFQPMLYTNPVIPYDNNNWVANHIWLHKGPVFLWLIAISFKLFGINELAFRLPSIILSTLMIPMIFRMGKLLVTDRVGYFAAILFTTANCQLEMVTGIMPSDHNDVVFMFFTCAGFWAWFEFNSSGKWGWIIFIGLFSGLAVDTKWVMGFLIFFCWLLTIILNSEKRKQLISYSDLIKCILIAIIVSAPWYIYAFIRFPAEMSGTLADYSQHFSSVVESHSGGGYYHLDLLSQHYGWIVPFILLPSFYFLYKALNVKKDFRILLISWFLSVEIFYAIARTKMPLFTIIIAPVIYFALGNLMLVSLEYYITGIKKYRLSITFIFVAWIGISNIGINEIEGHHTDTGLMVYQREKYIHNATIFKNVATVLSQKDYVIFNCKDFNAVQVMFYSGMTAYDNMPDNRICDSLQKLGVRIAVFNDDKLPAYILNDNKIVKLNYNILPDKPSI